MEDALTTHGEQGLGPTRDEVRELLAVRPGGLADVVRAIPALRHLRLTYPDARITVASSDPARELLEACPYVDRSISLDRPSEALLERFDLAVSFARPGTEGTLDLADVAARFRAAWSEPDNERRASIQPAWPARLPDSTRMLRMAWLLGGALDGDTGLGLWPTLADRNGAARLVGESTRPVALVHVGGAEARAWPVERWTCIVDLLERSGLQPVLVGSDDDLAATAAVMGAAARPPISTVGLTSVGQLVGLLERAALFVGADSGPAALAGALDVRSVIIGPSSSLEHSARPGLVDLVSAGACAECGEHACDHPAVDAIDVPLERVIGRVELAAATAVDRWERSNLA